ncbi:MAG TPA: carboxypeptidase-like regulatory domain-containing protein, partial [Planctomycetota bacterium]|nr:carboxypeptidase-like regulatory domain-containing protein [Planctomycetota bacterium]
LGLPNEVVHYHLGPRAMPWRGSLDGLTLRFAQRGRYLVRAVEVDGAGLVASALVDVDPRAEGEVVLDFEQGQVVAVTVTGDGDRALPRALVRLHNLTHPRHAPYQDETDEAGRARFAGLHAGDRFEVVVEARLHESKKQTIQAGSEARFHLKALPREQRLVTVVEALSNAPIQGAGLWLDSADGRDADFRSDAAGTARIEVHGDADHVLVVRADGFLPWRELTSSKLGGGVPRFVRLLPAARARQLELGLVGLVEGQVLRADGQPWKGISVRLVAARDASGQLLPDSIGDDGFVEVKDDAATKRPVLEGQRLEGTLDAITDREGRFELWCVQRGRARVLVLEKDAPSREVFVRLGAKVRADLR